MKLTSIPRLQPESIRDFDRLTNGLTTPIVVTGNGGAPWSLHDLENRYGQVELPVRVSDDEHKQFFGGPADQVEQKMLTLAEYLRLIEKPDPRGARPPYAGNISLSQSPEVAREVASLLAECQFPDCVPQEWQNEYRFWVGAAGQRSTIHNDAYHNFNAQMIGTKHFVLFAPDQHGALYPQFFHRGMWASPIDLDDPDLDRFPEFAKATGCEVELQEGEILFIPRFWWHRVLARTLAVNVNRWAYANHESWHQQPEARRFLSIPALLDRVRSDLAKLPQHAPDFQRREFERLYQEIEGLVVERGPGESRA
jgi:jumonji domain-containing protein 7